MRRLTLAIATLGIALPIPLTAVAQQKNFTQLYVGSVRGCNEGEVTTNPRHKNCDTDPIGWTVADGYSDRTTRVYVGTSPMINDGIVTTDTKFRNGGTRPIGYLTSSKTGDTALYAGMVDGCNNKVVTNNAAHLNCKTEEIGYAAR